jgi:hypothetical protein
MSEYITLKCGWVLGTSQFDHWDKNATGYDNPFEAACLKSIESGDEFF